MNSSRYICTFVSVGLVVTWKPGIPEFSRVLCWSIAFWSNALIKLASRIYVRLPCLPNFEVKLRRCGIHAVWFMGDTVEILISSHFVHTARYTDKRTHYNVPNFDIVPYSMSHTNHTECIVVLKLHEVRFTKLL